MTKPTLLCITVWDDGIQWNTASPIPLVCIPLSIRAIFHCPMIEKALLYSLRIDWNTWKTMKDRVNHHNRTHPQLE